MATKMVTIIDGGITDGQRLVGKTSAGVRYMMPKKDTAKLREKFADGKVPQLLYCIVDEVEYNETHPTEKDEKGNPKVILGEDNQPKKFKRNDILAAFLTATDCKTAFNSDKLLMIEAHAEVAQAATAAGLNTESLAELRAMSV
jgi:hypothetical protein